jgi:hypothetical protein
VSELANFYIDTEVPKIVLFAYGVGTKTNFNLLSAEMLAVPELRHLEIRHWWISEQSEYIR